MTNHECRSLQDRDEIQDVLFRYAKAADLPDGELMRSAFHADATDDHAGMFSGKINEHIPGMMETCKAFSFIQHAIGNISIKLDGDVADTECYVSGTMGYLRDGEQYHWVVGGRYVDRMERRNGEWRIAKRITHVDWERIVQVDSTLPTPF